MISNNSSLSKAIFLLQIITLAGVLSACDKEPDIASQRPLLEKVQVRTFDIANQDIEKQSGNFIIPRSVIVNRGGLDGLYIVSDSKARFRMIRPGKPMRGDSIEVLSGLLGSEVVVLDPSGIIYDGSPVSNDS